MGEQKEEAGEKGVLAVLAVQGEVKEAVPASREQVEGVDHLQGVVGVSHRSRATSHRNRQEDDMYERTTVDGPGIGL